jgi:hypothetical protein
MNAEKLQAYATAEIARLGLEDTETNCHGIVAVVDDGESESVRLSDGVGLFVVCTTTEEIDAELAEMADFYAEADENG